MESRCCGPNELETGRADQLGSTAADSYSPRLRAGFDLFRQLGDDFLNIGDIFEPQHALRETHFVRQPATRDAELMQVHRAAIVHFRVEQLRSKTLKDGTRLHVDVSAHVCQFTLRWELVSPSATPIPAETVPNPGSCV